MSENSDSFSTAECIPASVLGSDGTTYELGNLAAADNMLVAKRKLAENSHISMRSMSMFLIHDMRSDEEKAKALLSLVQRMPFFDSSSELSCGNVHFVQNQGLRRA